MFKSYQKGENSAYSSNNSLNYEIWFLLTTSTQHNFALQPSIAQRNPHRKLFVNKIIHSISPQSKESVLFGQKQTREEEIVVTWVRRALCWVITSFLQFLPYQNFLWSTFKTAKCFLTSARYTIYYHWRFWLDWSNSSLEKCLGQTCIYKCLPPLLISYYMSNKSSKYCQKDKGLIHLKMKELENSWKQVLPSCWTQWSHGCDIPKCSHQKCVFS